MTTHPARPRPFARLSLAIWLVTVFMGSARAADVVVRFDIEAQSAAEALAEFSAQSRQQLVFDFEAVQGIRTQRIAGELAVPRALERLLGGTGLYFKIINDRTISIVCPVVAAASGAAVATQPSHEPDVAARARRAGAAPRQTAVAAVRVEFASRPLEEIVVSAEKRDQILQRSALAVTARSSRELERDQVTNLKSVTTMIPNLQIGASSTQAAFDLALRGIVSTNRTEIGDAAVAFHVDGFYSPRPQGATLVMYDLDRLEALRGPQGTLFGRNANAGVINVVTAKPEIGALNGAVDLTRGNYELSRIKGHINVPLGDNFALRGAAFVEKREGFTSFLAGSNVDDSTARYDDSDKFSVRLSASWEPDGPWRMFASAERYADRGAGTIPVSLNRASGAPLRSALISSPGMLDMKNDTFHLRADLETRGNLELSYLFGWARMTRRNVSDYDVGLAHDPQLRTLPNPPVAATYEEERRTDDAEFISTQHEFQLKPIERERWDFLFGGFFYQEENAIRFDVDVRDDRGTLPGMPDAGDVRYATAYLQPHRQLSAWAGFSQLTWHASEAARVSVGARYTEDTKEDRGGINITCPTPLATIGGGGFNLAGIDTADIPFAPDPDSPVPVPGTCRITAHNDVHKHWSKVTYMARFEHDLRDGLLAYALTNTGFKSGVIQDGGTSADPEEVTNYELGLKASLLDGSMTVNTVGFYSDYSDILRAAVEWDSNGTQQLVTRNATRASIYGIESELQWQPTARDSVQAVFTYLTADYRDYQTMDAQYYITSDPLTPVVNLRGNKLPFAPTYTGAFIYEHFFRIRNGGRLIPRLQTKYQSEMFLTDFNRASDRQAGYTRTDLSLRYEAPGDWLVEAFVQNIEDEAVKNNVDLRGSQPGAGGVAGFPGVARAFFDAPRTYGLRAMIRFD